MKKLFSGSPLIALLLFCTSTPCLSVNLGVSSLSGQNFKQGRGDLAGLKIKRFVHSDGYIAEQRIAELMGGFLSHPDAYIKALAKCDIATQRFVIDALVHHAIAAGSTLSFGEVISRLEASALKGLLLGRLNAVQSSSRPNQQVEHDLPGYDAAILQDNVIAYQQLGFGLDEEFFAGLTKVYSKDTQAFAKAIASLNAQDLAAVALGMKTTAQKHPELKLEPDFSKIWALSAKEVDQLWAMEGALHKAELPKSPNTGRTGLPSPESGILPSANPAIGALNWSNLNVGAQAALSVAINDGGNKGSSRTYTIKVHCQRDGKWWLKHSGYSATLASGTSNQTFSVPVTFSHAGTFYTRVELFRGNTQVAERTGANPDVVKGNWRINVDLPSDRFKEGALGIYNAGGERVKPVIRCLGRSASNASMGTFQGNTPTGDNTATVGGVQSDTDAYGPYKVVMLVAKSGHPYPNRTGIWIHGGRNQSSLQPTHGCIRVFNADQKLIQDTLADLMSAANGHNATGQVIVQQVN